MKKKLIGLLLSIFLVVGMTSAAYSAVIWGINENGTGSGGVVEVGTFLEITTPNVILYDSPGSASFTNYGIVNITPNPTYGSFTNLFGQYEFSGMEIGGWPNAEFNPGGLMAFSAGSYGASPFATFELLGGTSVPSQIGATVNLNFKLKADVDPGYLFFKVGSDWVDMHDLVNADPPELILGLTFASAVDGPADDTVKSVHGLTIDDPLLVEQGRWVASNGHFFARTVPIPSAVLLLGSGLVGLVGFRRKNS